MTHMIRVTGMTCGHCARTVERAVSGLAGIENARVDHKNGTLTYSGDTSRADIAAAIEQAGYGLAQQEAGA